MIQQCQRTSTSRAVLGGALVLAAMYVVELGQKLPGSPVPPSAEVEEYTARPARDASLA